MPELQIQQRREKRTKAPNVGLVDVEVSTLKGPKLLGKSLMYDQSQSGVGIILDFRIAIGTRVSLQNRYVRYKGMVRHCQKLEVGYKIGLQLDK